jgi:DinB superfamily
MTPSATRRTADPRIELLLEIMDQAFDRKGWHGTTLRGSLRGLSADAALWRPAPGRHNIWELTVHAAYWKYAVRRRLMGDAVGSFSRKPSNWPLVPEDPGPAEWKREIRLLEAEHRLCERRSAPFPLPDLSSDRRRVSGPMPKRSTALLLTIYITPVKSS